MAQLLAEIQTIKGEFEQYSQGLEQLLATTGGNGNLAGDIAEARRLTQGAAQELDRRLRELDASGVELKSIDDGLLDFPSDLNGRIVYLCWRQGEPSIAYWHELDEGFAGRQAL